MTFTERLNRKIGETMKSRVEVRICKGCGFVIADTGLCDYGCQYDGGPHPDEQVLIRIWERTDVLVEVRNAGQPGDGE
jgi:hypothetical protein